MNLGIIISQTDSETVWNVYRLGNFALEHGDKVKVFLLGKGVESETEQDQFNVKQQVQNYIKAGGEIYACGSCMKAREMESTNTCQISSMSELYKIIKESDKVLTF